MPKKIEPNAYTEAFRVAAQKVTEAMATATVAFAQGFRHVFEQPCPRCFGWVGEDCDCAEYLADVIEIGPSDEEEVNES